MPVRAAPIRPRTAHPSISVEVAGRAVLVLTGAPQRVRVGLALPPLDRAVDVSVQPSAACGALAATARRLPLDAAEVEGRARDALRSARDRFASWAPDDDIELLAGFGGAAFPLLAAAYERGAAPVPEVPRWAEPVVSSTTARDGARVAFGPHATRPVVRALASTLASETADADDATAPTVGFSNLALALVGRDVLEPDRVARVLTRPCAAHPAGHLPDPSTLELAQRTVARWGPGRAERVLHDAADRPDGFRLLFDTIRYAQHLRGHGPEVLPNRLVELHDVHRTRVATAPSPPPRPAPRNMAPRPLRILEPPPAPAAPVRRLYAPPADLAAVRSSTPLPASAAVRSLDGRTADGLTFRVPRTAGDLERWGRLLSNCLGGFGAAVVAGRSTIVGIEVQGAIRYAVEVGASGAVRQFAGPANRAPTPAIRETTLRVLREAGVVTADDR